ncbi:MAG: ECF transporter S component [Clostridia bacterium]|nr:ECF transporter S component [Clostridia bacterium]
MKHANKINYIAKVAILSAIAFIIMLFEMPLAFIAPTFYEMDFSDVIALVGSFALGPVAGVLIELLKNLLNILFTGSSTAYVGEFANFVTGCAFILPAALVYKFNKTRKHAVIGLVLSTLSLAIVGGLINYFVMVPMYAELYIPMETIIGMASAIIPAVDSLWKMILLCVVPFNMIKGVLCGVITFVLYKKLAVLLKK